MWNLSSCAESPAARVEQRFNMVRSATVVARAIVKRNVSYYGAAPAFKQRFTLRNVDDVSEIHDAIFETFRTSVDSAGGLIDGSLYGLKESKQAWGKFTISKPVETYECDDEFEQGSDDDIVDEVDRWADDTLASVPLDTLVNAVEGRLRENVRSI
jgi:hypothetical protein